MRLIPSGHKINFFLLTSLLWCTGCREYDNANNSGIPQPELKDFWVHDALTFITRIDSILPYEVLRAEVGDGSVVAKMFFDRQSNIYKIIFVDHLQFEHRYYLEGGLLSYSRHVATEINNQIDWFMAYAQHLPYAAAKKELDGSLSEADPQKLPWRNAYASEVLTLVEQYQLREKHTAMVRVHSIDTIIKGEINPNTSIRYTLNVSKGEKLRLDLRSVTPNIFFMLKPMPGADMVRKLWEGEAQRTGDLYITVFSIRDDKPESFELRIGQKDETP